jgi:predicted Zn-dependent peptidase
MYIKEHLENGIPVVMESFRNVRSAAVGVWVKIGSRYETPPENGISHFLEHMFFKGTKRYTAKDIAVEIDTMGGDLNAFTSREHTAFYVKVLDEYLDKGINLLSEIFVSSLFPEDEIEKEKKIIKEEIKMVEDTPDDYIHDLFNLMVWGHEGLGQSILGRRETIASFTRGDILNHIRKYYGTRDIVIACAGNFDHGKVMQILNDRFGGLRRGSEPKMEAAPEFRFVSKVYVKDMSEAHVCIGVPALSQVSDDRYALFVLNTILGGSVSSRLFQEIRENRGLAYSVYSFTAMYHDTGLWGVYAGISRKRVREVCELILGEMMTLKDTLSDDELEKAKRHLKGNMLLALESANSRMNNIARQEMYFGRYISPDDIIRSVDRVSMKQIRELAVRLIRRDGFSVAAYGPLEKDVLDGVFEHAR